MDCGLIRENQCNSYTCEETNYGHEEEKAYTDP